MRADTARHLLGVLLEADLRASGASDLESPEHRGRMVALAVSLTDELISALGAAEADGAEPIIVSQSEGSAPATGDRPLTEHQKRVGELIEVFEQFGAQPPRPGVLAHWIKLTGDFEEVRRVLVDLGARGHLEKGSAYIYQVLLTRTEIEQAVEHAARSQPLPDGTGLPGGERWSTQLQRAVPEAEWKPERDDP